MRRLIHTSASAGLSVLPSLSRNFQYKKPNLRLSLTAQNNVTENQFLSMG